MQRIQCTLGTLIAALLLAESSGAAEPRRIDHGDLIVLEVYGSYHEMGQQLGELLGEDGRGERDRAVASYARAAALMDEVPAYSSYDFMRDQAAAGQAHALGPDDVEIGGWLTHTPP